MPLDLNRYTEKAAQAFMAAQKDAQEHNHSQLEPLHLLAALLAQREGVVPQVIEKVGASPAQVQAAVQEELNRLPQAYGATQQVYLSKATDQVVQRAEDAAGRMRDEYISTEHLLLGLVDDRVKGPAGELLRRFGIQADAILQALTSIRGSQRVTSQNPESTYQALERYGRDITKMARENKLDPVIGRDDEILSLIHI